MDNNKILSNIIHFLKTKEWHEDTPTKRSLVFINDKIGSDFRLFVPKLVHENDFLIQAQKTIQSLCSIHSENNSDLKSLIIKNREILSIKFEADQIYDDGVKIVIFSNIVSRLNILLTHAAAFTITNKPILSREDTKLSKGYLDRCRFIKNEKGSLITKIELPKDDEIYNELYDQKINSKIVNKRLFDSINFINNTILAEDVNYSDDYIDKNISNINLSLISDIRLLYKEVPASTISVLHKSIESDHNTTSGSLGSYTTQKIKLFEDAVKLRLRKI